MQLATTSSILRITTDSAANLDVLASYVDLSSGVASPIGTQTTAFSSATTSTVASAPSSGVVRRVYMLTACNRHASLPVRVTLEVFDGTTAYQIDSITLRAGEMWQYTEGGGFQIFDAGGRAYTAYPADPVTAGMQPPRPLVKTGITMAAVAALRGYTPIYVAGSPGAASAPSDGINGAALSGNAAGFIDHTNPASGNAYIAELQCQASTPGMLWIVDRMWQNSGLSVTSTSAQSITPATLPARDVNASTNGEGVIAAIEWSATGGAGTPTVTASYTDDAGNTGNSAAFTGVTTPPVGTVEIFPLASGDKGVRSVQSITQSATRTSGTMHLILFRILDMVPCTAANIPTVVKRNTRLYNDVRLQPIWIPSATTAVNLVAQLTETQY